MRSRKVWIDAQKQSQADAKKQSQAVGWLPMVRSKFYEPLWICSSNMILFILSSLLRGKWRDLTHHEPALAWSIHDSTVIETDHADVMGGGGEGRRLPRGPWPCAVRCGVS